SVRRAGYFIFLACVMASAIFAPTSTRSADQAQKVARVAFVDPYSASASTNRETSEFWTRLQELGWIRGQNLAAETRWADGQVDLNLQAAKALGLTFPESILLRADEVIR